MNTFKFQQSKIALYVSVMLGTSCALVVQADELDKEKEVEVIEVRGIKGSLIRSMNVKREMSGVVDAISAEEMGKFPDTNLAESLQRITGVSISRTNGEGSQITVRGFGPQFNLVTLNGRQMPGTGNSRSYSFENLSSDGVSALELYKTARADNPTGGLGATVNIVTSKPLDSATKKISLSAKAIHDSSNVAGDDVTPEFSAIYSNAFLDETIGFSLSVNHHRRDFQQQSASIQGWLANVDLPTNLDESKVIDHRPVDENGKRIGNHFFPRDMNYGINDFQRERTNGHAVFQFSPNDAMLFTVDYVGTKAVTGMNGISWGMWNDFGGNINAYEIDDNGTVVYADISGNDGSFTASRETTEVTERSIGFNFDWQITDSLALTLDFHDSQSETDNGADKGLGSSGSLVLGSDQLTTKIYDFRNGEVPHAEILWKNGSNELLASEIDSHFSQFVHSPGETNVKQLQLDGLWDAYYDEIGLVNVKFGIAHTEQEMGGSIAWSGLIGGFLFNPSWPEMFPDGMFTRHDTSDFLDAFAGGGSALNPHYYYTFNFDEVVARSQAFLTNELLGGDDYFATTAYHDMGTFSKSSVLEKTTSVYLSSFWEFDVADYPVQVNAGLRYEETDVTSRVLQQVPTAVWWKGGSEWHTQYLPGEDNTLSLTGEHDVFLPMLDIRVDLTDDLVSRVSWGKTITRAPLGDLAGGRSLSGSPKIGSRSGSEGNTNLQPFESTNFDLSLEWYYAEGSYASIGYYDKSVKNFIGSQIVSTSIEGFNDIYNGPRWNQAVADIEARGEQATNDAIFAQMQANGATINEQGYITPSADDPLMVWDIRQPFNAPDVKNVDGFEIALQHLFGESGFGFGVNVTTVNGDVEFNANSLDQQTPLEGLSDSANIQAFYEKDGLSVKFTYAWREDFLLGVGQDQGSSDNPPQNPKEFKQLDMSVNYDVTDQVTVFFEGLNLNNETEQAYGRYERQFLYARQYGPRYALGVRYSFN